jgi:hypothetical protein
MFPAEGITFNAFKATLPTTDVDWSSTNDEETQVGFNLNSYLPDREGETFIEDWEKTWLRV